MNKALSAPFTSAARPAAAIRFRTAGIVLGGSALVAICAHVSLPLYFTPVPLTLQPFAVLLLGLLLSPRLAAATLGTYLLEGALGLPVFAAGAPLTAGMTHLFGPTGGYLLAYPLAAAIVSFLWNRTRRGFVTAFVSAAAGSLAILASGALWLTIFFHGSAHLALTLAVLPFLPGDALQVAAAAAAATGLRRRLRAAA
ncbi:MAG: biotin transporter BioY [Acidobacteriota bacterium]